MATGGPRRMNTGAACRTTQDPQYGLVPVRGRRADTEPEGQVAVGLTLPHVRQDHQRLTARGQHPPPGPRVPPVRSQRR
jgi:hypothetical protein